MPRTLQERTAIVAGMRAAQAAGKHVGRPPPKAWRLAKLRRLLRDEPDISWNALAKRVRISPHTVKKYSPPRWRFEAT
jgi:DNA invertase Pin-like site-specific DNA recombinase